MQLDQDVFKHIRRIQIKANKYVHDVLAGAYHSTFKGRGMEFEDVREYQPGDEVRSIDWNVTARMQYPYVKNHREERELTVILMVDVSKSSYFGTLGKQKESYIAEVAALIAFSAIKNNDKVGLILFSDRIEKYVPPAKGMKHALRMIYDLIVFKPKSSQTDVSSALNFLAKIYKKRGVAFLISDFLSPSFKYELTLCSKKHEIIGISINDPLEYQIPKMGLVEFKDLESSKTVLVDTQRKRVRKHLESQMKTQKEELKKTFESLASGYIEMKLGQNYLNPLIEYFKAKK